MRRAGLFSDDLVRRLIGVGQVDIVVGVPTLNHEATIAETLDVVDAGLLRYFPRARTVVIGADGGSKDRTLDIVSAPTSNGAGATAGALRTRHRIGVSYGGVPGRAGALRLIFMAADLLQAQSVAVCDPDAGVFMPDCIGTLLEPVSKQSLDMVAAQYTRHPLEGLLVTQLIRPLMRSVYGSQFEQPLLDVFACSRRFAAGCLAQDVWDQGPIREGIDLWLVATALSGDYRAGQASLGRLGASRRPASLHAVFAPLVGALFATLERQASAWMAGAARSPAAMSGCGDATPIDLDPPPSADSAWLAAAFVDNVRDVRPVLQQILTPGTFGVVCAIADEAGGAVRYDDQAWVDTVYDFVAAHHHGVMDRAHIVQALMPLYLGRVASFVASHAGSSVDDTQQSIERLSQQFEGRRQHLIDRWNRTT